MSPHIKPSLNPRDATHTRTAPDMLPAAPACSGSFYPGTGAANECGEGPGEGFTVNVPWQCGGMGNGDYVAAFQHVLLPIAMEFNPDLIIASAGEGGGPSW